jgi:FkbM family methyltransferase
MSPRSVSTWSLARPVLIAVIAAGAIALALPLAAFLPSNPVSLGLMAVTGRFDEACTWTMARNAAVSEQRRNAARVRVAKQSTIVRRDGNLLLLQTAYGPSWISGLQPDWEAQFFSADLYHWPPRWAEDPTRPLVQPGGILLDGGGHIGESSATALRLGAKRVITIEPDPVNAEAIRRNLAFAIADGRLTILQVGVWDGPGTLVLERGTASTRSETHAEAHGEKGISVPVTTIDAIVRDLHLPQVDAIKLDIEGAEPHALGGAKDTLGRFKPKLAVGTYHQPGDLAAIREIVHTAQPEYTERATRCLPAHGRIQPHELFFE